MERLLELRWEHELPDGRFPETFLKGLRKHGRFKQMVRHYEQHGALALVDLDFQPRITRLPGDHGVHDLLVDELGDDPKLYACIDCGEAVKRGTGRCEECAHWRATGKTTTGRTK